MIAVVGNKLEQEIIGVYAEDISAAYSINEIAGLVGRQYPHIHAVVTRLIGQGILKTIIVGRSHLCSINLASDEAVLLMSLNEAEKKKSLLKKKPSVATLLSRVVGNKRELGLRLVLQVGGEMMVVLDGDILPKAKASLSSMRVMDVDEFKAYLVDEAVAMRDHVVLYSFESYFMLMRECEGKLRLKNAKILI